MVRNPNVPVQEVWKDTEELGDDCEAQKELQAEIDTEFLLNRLTKRQKQCFKLRLNGYKYKEIAHKLNITINAVALAMYHARQKIRIFY